MEFPGRGLREPGDIALVLGAIVVIVVGTNVISESGAGPDPLGWTLLVLAGAALLFRRAWPAAVMWIVIAIGLLYDLLGNPGAFSTVAIVVAVYSAASAGLRGTAIAGVVGALGLFYLTDEVSGTGHFLAPGGAVWFAGWLVAGLLLGEVSRSRIERAATAEQQAREAERHREEEARRKESEERMRIARDLHDVLAHSISIINVQSGVAAHHLDDDIEKSRAALKTVRDTGRQVLRELRSSLGVLRDPDADPHPPRAPSPGIDDIEELVEATRHTGLKIDLNELGNLEALPTDVGLAVYRVVQESLTNVTRHAGATAVSVTLDRRPGELRVRVDDNGSAFDGRRPTSAAVEGHGITGMRERLQVLGGVLEVGPLSDNDGFRVEARIPLGDS